jgi:hypothetical protein
VVAEEEEEEEEEDGGVVTVQVRTAIYLVVLVSSTDRKKIHHGRELIGTPSSSHPRAPHFFTTCWYSSLVL